MTTLTSDDVQQGNVTRLMSAQLCRAHKDLHQMHLNARALCDEFLLPQIENADMLDDKQKNVLVRGDHLIGVAQLLPHNDLSLHQTLTTWRPAPH